MLDLLSLPNTTPSLEPRSEAVKPQEIAESVPRHLSLQEVRDVRFEDVVEVHDLDSIL